ncbi:sigma-70 family RNA polymerase sigma factor [Sporosarcina gallistercoris]|uniref:Sigma-70 family RNA polymerase sigma factor n=1 Tax=Sporosarcina gallistercoris TaxID=2762245 RepID=A0ABR8PHP5_9BACL|nr:sigma-70 family RNA polymerase sigma factor [Sporosarcina gallistercoris]MBD7907685.1 sigma-70 family RNA polymerase sigma factor [Sporosarcina gallistercoris]
MPRDNKSVPEWKQDEWLEQLMDQYGNRLTNLAFSYLKDWGRAQEVVQDVFVTCFHRAHQLDEIRSIEAWLYRITINRCKDVLKSSWFKRVIVGSPLFQFLRSKEYIPHEHTLQNSEDEQLVQCVLALPLTYREVILLYYYEDLTVPEISALLDVNQNTLRTRLKRGREQLAQLLEGGDQDER